MFTVNKYINSLSLPIQYWTWNGKYNYENNTDIVSNYNISNELIQMNRPYFSYSGEFSYKPLVLLHYSDLHGDVNTFSELNIFYIKYRNYITDVLNTGDTVLTLSTSDISFYDDFSISYNTLITIGNHDVWKSYNDNTNILTATEAYNRYIKTFVNTMNVVISGSVCYYYKDYADSSIRIIVIDDFHYDTT